MMAYTIFIKLLQHRTEKFAAFTTIEQALANGTGTGRAIIDEVFFIATSHAIHIFLIVFAPHTIEAAKSEGFIMFHL